MTRYVCDLKRHDGAHDRLDSFSETRIPQSKSDKKRVLEATFSNETMHLQVLLQGFKEIGG